MSAAAGSISARLEEQISRELAARRAYSPAEFPDLVEAGQGREVVDGLIFFTEPTQFDALTGDLLHRLAARLGDARPEAQELSLDFLVDLALATHSFLPRWNLTNQTLHGAKSLSERQLAAVREACKHALSEWEALTPVAADNALARRRDDAEARLRAEEASDPEAMAATLAGDSLASFVANVAGAIEQSNLLGLSELRARGETPTELGNDYAAFLQHAMYLGASFVTSNPVLVDIAWMADPDRWCPVMDSVVARNPGADDEALTRLATLEVVLANMHLLRPIFLLTGGKKGYVSLQVNPKKHGDSRQMIADVTAIYGELTGRLDGGVPNVVFKLPATKAGLVACRHVTGRGIGVNITVNFAMFQQLPFAQAIHEGEALAAYLTEMNGRLAYPIRDELLGRLKELEAEGISEAQAREAAAWSGVAVVKRLHGLLSEKGYDLSRVQPLIASLRWYTGDQYAALPNPCPDVVDCVGVSVITVFPNIRHDIDNLEAVDWRPNAIEEPLPADPLDVLTRSELFKQSYHVSDAAWVADDSRFEPTSEIRLEDEAATAAVEPVRATLKQFGEAYDAFVERLRGRKALMALRQAAESGERLPVEAVRAVLTNVFEATVAEGLRLVADAEQDAALAALLGEEAVCAAAAAPNAGSGVAELHRQALARHG